MPFLYLNDFANTCVNIHLKESKSQQARSFCSWLRLYYPSIFITLMYFYHLNLDLTFSTFLTQFARKREFSGFRRRTELIRAASGTFNNRCPRHLAEILPIPCQTAIN